MENEQCPVCGSGTLHREVINEEFEYKSCSITIPHYVVYRCSTCGEGVVDKSSLKESGKLLKDFQREVDGLLAGGEIKRIRTKLGLSQSQMAEILGGGAKAFARYEAGSICQSKAMDSLLRILDAYPNVIDVIREKPSSVYEQKKVLRFEEHVIYKQEYSLQEEGTEIAMTEDLADGA